MAPTTRGSKVKAGSAKKSTGITATSVTPKTPAPLKQKSAKVPKASKASRKAAIVPKVEAEDDKEEKAVEKAKIPKNTFHELKHLYPTALFNIRQHNENSKGVQNLLQVENRVRELSPFMDGKDLEWQMNVGINMVESLLEKQEEGIESMRKTETMMHFTLPPRILRHLKDTIQFASDHSEITRQRLLEIQDLRTQLRKLYS